MSTASEKAVMLRALQQRLAALEQAKGKSNNVIATAATTTAANASTAQPAALVAAAMPATPAPAAAAAATSTSHLSPLEQVKAQLAAKLAAKAAANGTAGTQPLNAAAAPFTPSAAAATTAGSATAAAAARPAAAAAAKPYLCRSWLTCAFGTRCRFRHPTAIDTAIFFEYGGRVLLHLNATALLAARTAGVEPPASALVNATMPPVLLLVLALLVQQSRTAAATAAAAPARPSMPLAALWTALREQLAGSRDLPSSQDDLLNTLGLPTTASVLVRTSTGGESVIVSTEAFRNMYACVFTVERKDGVFTVAHQWDDARRARLQQAAEATEELEMQQQQQRPKWKAKGPATAAAAAASASSAMSDDPEGDMSRKRKRVTDAELEAQANGGVADHHAQKHSKRAHAGEAWPEDEHMALAPAFSASAASTAAAAAVSSAPRGSPTNLPSGAYSLDAGAELGGATAFVRGGIVTELSLLATTQQTRQQQQQAQRPAYDPYAHEDAFTRAIRMQGQKQVSNASYTVQTKKISSGRGFDMLQRMNWRHGQGLGKREQGRVEPLEVKLRADRMGL